MAAMLFAACGSDGDGDAVAANRVEFDPAVTIKPDADGQTVLLITGKEGTSWSAEITAGSEWVSFSGLSMVGTATGTVGSSQSAREKYVYYKANRSGAERTAEITFTFEGEAPQPARTRAVQCDLRRQHLRDRSGGRLARNPRLSRG